MSLPRPFLLWPDVRLRARAAPVTGVGATERAIWDEMLEAMYAMPGVGLAAPQIGVGLRLAVLDCSAEQDQPVRLANPVLIAATGSRAHEEASPNLPGISARVERAAEVTIRYLDEAGASVERVFTDLWATSVQHQIDHLDGLLYPDRLGPVKRRMLLDRYAKLRRRAG